MSPQLRGSEVLGQDIEPQDPGKLIPPVGRYTIEMYYAAGNAGYDGKSQVADTIPLIDGGYAGLEEFAKEVALSGGDLVAAFESTAIMPDQSSSGKLHRAEAGMSPTDFALSLRSDQTFSPDSNQGRSRLKYGARLTCDGRYATEVYPLDSLPVVQGLLATGEVGQARDIIDNETREILTFGYPFNGYHLRGRTGPDGKPWPYNYYAGRTQFPTYFDKIRALAEHYGEDVYIQYQPAMVRLWKFYNEGSDQLNGPADGKFHANRRLVKTPDGLRENRHWDDTNNNRPFDEYIPRLESVVDDMNTAAEMAERVPERYRDRVKAAHYVDRMAAGESGEDFSADRWAGGRKDLSNLKTTRILPVDLQCAFIDAAAILEHSFNLSGEVAERQRDTEGVARAHRATVYFANERLARAEAVQRYHYDPVSRTFRDVELVGVPLAESYSKWRQTDSVSLAAMYALHAGVSDMDQSLGVTNITRGRLLRPGGLMVTSRETGQQWDAPNSWSGKALMAIKSAVRAAARFPGTPAAQEMLEFAREARRSELHGYKVRFAISRMFEEKRNAANPYLRAVSGTEYNNKADGEDHVNFSMSSEGYLALEALDIDEEYGKLVDDYHQGAGSLAMAAAGLSLHADH